MTTPTLARELLRLSRRRLRDRRPIRLAPYGPMRGRALLSYVIDGFRVSPDGPLATGHTNIVESVQIASTLRELGYRVDVIDYLNDTFTPREPYDVLIDPRHNTERLAAAVGQACVKILHADTAHIAYQNAAENRRLLDIQQRRGVTLTALRQEPVNHALERADVCVYLGSDFCADTYRYAGKPLHRARIGGFATPTAPVRDFERARRRFLWLGSWGLVLKGLDLVLEAFAGMGDVELVVCGPVDREPDFADAYAQELWHTPNIDVRGWTDIASPAFAELVASCAGVVYASASEGASGAVINAMHTGLVPLVTYEASVDVPAGGGTLLADQSVTAIQAAVQAFAQRPPHEVAEMSRVARAHVRANHTRERFAADYRHILTGLLDLPSPAPALSQEPRT